MYVNVPIRVRVYKHGWFVRLVRALIKLPLDYEVVTQSERVHRKPCPRCEYEKRTRARKVRNAQSK